MFRRFAFAGLAGMAALAFIAANAAQAAENHNSSRSNRGQNLMPTGNKTGGPAPAAASTKGYINGSGGSGIAQPGKGGTGTQGGVAVKEEGVKKQ